MVLGCGYLYKTYHVTIVLEWDQQHCVLRGITWHWDNTIRAKLAECFGVAFKDVGKLQLLAAVYNYESPISIEEEGTCYSWRWCHHALLTMRMSVRTLYGHYMWRELIFIWYLTADGQGKTSLDLFSWWSHQVTIATVAGSCCHERKCTQLQSAKVSQSAHTTVATTLLIGR